MWPPNVSDRHQKVKEVRGPYLRASPVVVQTGEAGKVLFGDRGSRLGCNQTVGVGRVSHNQHLNTQTNLKNIYHADFMSYYDHE